MYIIKSPSHKPEAGTTPRDGIPRPRVDDTAFLTSLCYVPAGIPSASSVLLNTHPWFFIDLVSQPALPLS